MKNLKFKNYYSIFFFMISVLALSSCSSDDNSASGKPPVIEKVSQSVIDVAGTPSDLSPVTQAQANQTCIIHGSGFKTLKKVYFNNFDTSFNPNLVTDTDIFVTIDVNTPYVNQIDKLKLVTEYGEVEYDFVVAPPAPQISSYNSINANAGDEFTIFGSFFLDPVVTVGTTQATVVSSTLTEIRAIMPASSQFQLVKVTTISGSATASQPVGTAIYDDATASFVENWLGPWDGSGFTASTDVKIQGNNSIKVVFGAYVGFKVPMYAATPTTTAYKGIRVSFKSTKETGKFKVVINNNYGAGKEISFTSNWSSFVIPFSDLGGNPGYVNEIVFQEFGNGGGDTLYIDDIGFVLN